MARTSGEGAHPRVGGENKDALAAVKGTAGSSPRGRGKRSLLRQAFRLPGLIPAWAGKTFSPAASISAARAHPRVGGENVLSCGKHFGCQGSSPRGRGKREYAADREARGRLIPAWAGKTGDVPSHRKVRRAHPRVGGENGDTSRPSRAAAGSSPRGRGKRERDPARRRAMGRIPAWAGKTGLAVGLALGARAHPRVGGENRRISGHPDDGAGSSPRGRGKHDHRVRREAEQGLIPAWAGKT